MLRRSFTTLILTVAVVASSTVTAGVPHAIPPWAGTNATPMALLAPLLGDFPEMDAPPRGQTPEERARWVLEQREALGRTPMSWVELGRSLPGRLSSRGAAGVRPAEDLVSSVERLYALLGVSPTPVARRALTQAARAVPSAVARPFAALARTVVDAYETQVPLARAVAARLVPGLDPRTPLLRETERDRMAAIEMRVVEALGEFRAAIASSGGSAAELATPIFTDPEGLIVLGSPANDTYVRSGVVKDPVLLVDPGGSDVYRNSAGGACPVAPAAPTWNGVWLECNGLALSVVADLGGAGSDDLYLYDGPPAAVQGAGGPGGIGILVDAGGNDRYESTMTRRNSPPFFIYFDGGAQGFGFGGAGVLLDGAGDDVYRHDVLSTAGHSIWALAQGFGGGGGLGLAVDAAGADQWIGRGLGLVGGGFEGVYTQGAGIWFGVGVLTDLGPGNDAYRGEVVAQSVDYYAQGFGGLWGAGILYDDGGSDNYYSMAQATDPIIDPLLNCAFGTGSLFGVGVMIDASGDDVYYGGSVSPSGASVMDSGFGGPGTAYGLFLDKSGNDRYTMEAQGSSVVLQGRGLYEPDLAGSEHPDESLGHNTWGTFADLGGRDVYVGGPGQNDAQWPFGVDRER